MFWGRWTRPVAASQSGFGLGLVGVTVDPLPVQVWGAAGFTGLALGCRASGSDGSMMFVS